MYKAALFASDGDWVADYRRETVQEVWEAVNAAGSRWFCFPIAVVIVDHGVLTTGAQRIVAAPDAFAMFKGHSLKTFGGYIAANPDEVKTILEP